MKNIALLLFTLLTIKLHAQIVIDDFSTGNFSTLKFSDGESEKLFQRGNGILGNLRRIHVKVGENIYGQSPQLTNGKNGLMAYSSGYDVNSTIYLSYGYDKNGAKELNLDLTKYSRIKIDIVEFKIGPPTLQKRRAGLLISPPKSLTNRIIRAMLHIS